MYSYIKGTITEVESNYITIDVNGVGYLVYTANPYQFEIDKEYKVYLYQYVREDEMSLYGFKSIEDKNLSWKQQRSSGGGNHFPESCEL